MSTGAGSAISYGVDRLERLAAIEETHFWSEGRRDLLVRLLAPRLASRRAAILDAGCGTGKMLGELRQLGQDPVGLDALPEAVELARGRCPGTRVELGSVTDLPFADASFDGLLLLDVLEHVDDRRALAEAARVLRSGGFLAIAAPAGPWLWSQRDVVAGHLRRYNRRLLVERLEAAGFVVERVTHYQFALFPFFALVRLLGRRNACWLGREESVPAPLGRVLAAVNRVEARLVHRVSWPVGSSVVALAVKP